MDDDWGLQAVVRGCSAVLSASGAATSSPTRTTTTTTKTTTRSSDTIMSGFDFQSFNNNNNNNNSFLFSASSSSSSSFGSNNSKSQSSDGFGQLFSLSDPIATRPQRNINGNNSNNNHNNRIVVEDLHDLYKPFFVPKPEPNSLNTCTTMAPNNNNNNILSSNDLIIRPLQPIKQVHNNINRSFSSTSSSSTKHSSVSSSTTPRSKKRKNQMKKVCQVPAESLSSDIWAWRKYGQKPIKGSPYPRGYYRCSSSKGCLARKQVERNRSDPGMFIVTYTCEHNHPAPTHRNSLAGSTRQKPSLTTATEDPTKPVSESTVKPSSPATSLDEDLTAALSGSATESKEGPDSSTMLMEDEEDDEFGISDMAVSDDFFVGLEGLGASVPDAGDFFSDNSPPNFGLPWPASSAATAAGGS